MASRGVLGFTRRPLLQGCFLALAMMGEPQMLTRATLRSVLFTTGLFGVSAAADIPASLIVDPGSTAVIELEITVTGPDGSETKSDSRVVSLGGEGAVRFTPDFEPFNGMILDALVLRPGDCNLGYEFFCNPIFGCIDISVDLRQLTATLQGSAGASIVGDQVGWGAPWRLVGDYTIDSLLFSSGGVIDVTTEVGFNGRISVGDGGWRLDQMLLGTIVSDVPADSLPDGISVQLRTSVGLGGAALVGNYDPPPPAACGSGGDCNLAHDSPGCDDIPCCEQVCEADPLCCEVLWDQNCANLAIESCVIPPPNDQCDQARDLGLGRFAFTSVNADTDGPPLATGCLDQETGGAFVGDVWFRHTTAVDNGILVSTCGHAEFDTRIAIYTGCGGTLLTCSDDVIDCPGGTSRCAFYGVAGETYLIRVGGKFGTGIGEIDIAWGDVDRPSTAIAPAFTEGVGANGHHYVVRSLLNGGTWTDAVETAARFGGYPATITSPGENDFVVLRASPCDVGGPTTFGLLQAPEATDPAEDWFWITGEEFYFSNWNVGEPNDAGRGEDYATIYRNGLWNDGAEGFGHVLIEFDEPPALDEVTWESSSGGTGARYQGVITELPVSWSEARALAQQLGGELASLETEAEADFLFENLVAFHSLWTMTNYNGGPWIGLELVGGSWQWTSGVPLDWNPWRPGEPNGTGDKGCFFSYLDGPRREMDDTFNGNVRRAFIVEFEPDDTPCLGDIDGNGVVNGGDLGLVLGDWGPCPKGCAGDINGDGVVNGADLGLLLGAWGPCP